MKRRRRIGSVVPKKYCAMPTAMAPSVIRPKMTSSRLKASQSRASSALKKRAFHWITVTATATKPSSPAITPSSNPRAPPLLRTKIGEREGEKRTQGNKDTVHVERLVVDEPQSYHELAGIPHAMQ